MSNLDRTLAYLKQLPRARSGSGGHAATLRAACECVRFGLTEAEQLQALTWYSDNMCDPPWTERELMHKLTSARTKAVFGERVGAGGRQPAPAIRPVTADELRARSGMIPITAVPIFTISPQMPSTPLLPAGCFEWQGQAWRPAWHDEPEAANGHPWRELLDQGDE